MRDRHVSLHHAAAAALWAVAVILLIVRFVTGASGLGQLALLVAGAGGVLNIRGFVCSAITGERESFEIGREYAELKRIH